MVASRPMQVDITRETALSPYFRQATKRDNLNHSSQECPTRSDKTAVVEPLPTLLRCTSPQMARSEVAVAPCHVRRSGNSRLDLLTVSSSVRDPFRSSPW